jgi:predicted transcriptional regulator
MTNTPQLHPKEREQLERASRLVVTTRSNEGFHETVRDALSSLDRGEDIETAPTIAFGSYDELLATFTPRTLDLIEAVRTETPQSINETARVVDRDVKNVHEELSQLAQLGVIYFEEEGQSKRPVVWFEELVINLPFDPETGDAAPAPS